MEDVLDVYARPYDPIYPLVCLDECSKALHSTPGKLDCPRKGTSTTEDYEYERKGTRNLFLWSEPLTGRRSVRVTNRRTRIVFAEELRHLVDVHFPEATKVVLVTDNLNTHRTVSLEKAFGPEEARRISDRIVWHYTPENGSWLNMAEIELSVLSRQCLSRRIADERTLIREVTAWANDRNSCQVKTRWQFRTRDARIKLHSLYPEHRKSGLN